MANAFGADENCLSAYLFESGAFDQDSVGDTVLDGYYIYGVDPVIDTVNYAEGAASSFCEQYVNDPWYVTNEPSDFPLHATTGSQTFSITFWYYLVDIAYESTFYMIYKASSFALWLEYFPSDEPAYVTLVVWVYGDGYYEADIPITADQWYHIGLTFDASTKECKLRVYDAVLETTATWSHTYTTNPALNSNEFIIGDYYGEAEFNMDEVAIFKDVLTPAEIDAIRAGTFGSGGAAGSAQAAADAFFGLSLGCPF